MVKRNSKVLLRENSNGSVSSKTKTEKWFELGFPEEKLRSTCIFTPYEYYPTNSNF